MSTSNKKSSTKTQAAELRVGDKSITDLPVLKGTQGNAVIDVTGLNKHGIYTFDPGFMSTASCESHITFIDGQKGRLLYRGYPIEQLAQQCEYLEVCYLLLHEELPTSEQYDAFAREIKKCSHVPDDLPALFSGLPKNGHPMALLLTAVGALASYYHDKFDVNNVESCRHAALNIVAKMPILVAMCYRHTAGLPFIKPRTDLDYSANFLHMLFAKSDEDTQLPSKTLIDAMDHIFTLHADHSQNASTSTLRLAGSTGADPYACVAAAIAALWGPAHGGANEACLNMLEAIGDVSRIPEYLAKAKDSNDPFRLMGFGHRVYKNYDPRAIIMRKMCYDVLTEQGKQEESLFIVAKELEKIALEDDYFKSRHLYPNIDFYSGITQNAIGIPTNLFTTIFALARTVGWVSHWLEMLESPHFRLNRPRQLYSGPTERAVVPLAKR